VLSAIELKTGAKIHLEEARKGAELQVPEIIFVTPSYRKCHPTAILTNVISHAAALEKSLVFVIVSRIYLVTILRKKIGKTVMG
jgi:hypothetical protein